MRSNLVLLLATSASHYLLLFSSIYPQPAATTNLHNNYTDLQSLLAFKSHVADPYGILAANWTADTPFCEWVGVQCGNPQRQRVTSLDLDHTDLHGTIAPHLGNLTFLSSLFLGNCSLSGPIPDTLGRLPRLSVLNFEINALSGTIPNNIFNMSSLTGFYANRNSFSGSLSPNNIINLPRLQVFAISETQLTGEIPSSFARCKDLQMLSLSANDFTGNIPAELGNLSQLTLLSLGFNQLTGPIPSSLGNLTQLQVLAISDNNLTGSIPDELVSLPNLNSLYVGYNELSGSIPISLLNASQLGYFNIAFNNITGPVPAEIGKSMPLVNDFYLNGNQLTGGLDFIASLSNCRYLQSLDFSYNEFKGVIPISIGNLSVQLQSLNIINTRIGGNLPAVLGNFSQLFNLGLSQNELVGQIPLELSKLKMLQALDLSSNGLTGPIPREMGQLKSLTDLQLFANRLYGPIPDSLGNLTNLQHLLLARNSLSSRIPQALWNLIALLDLDLSDNLLNGTLPLQIGSLEALNHLDLHNNRLSGNISSSLGTLQMLSYLNLAKNSFAGLIPEILGNIINIEYMNLSHNLLSGSIPKSLAALRYLDSLDLSFNKLAGQIPQGRVFSNQTIPSLQGNEALCGALLLQFPPCPGSMRNSTNSRRMQLIKYIASPIATAFVLLACIYILRKFIHRREAKAQSPSDTQWLNNFRSISYHELVRATQNFSEENLLGRGSCSSVYQACLDDGMIIALKVINLACEEASKSFEVECQALSTVRHRNLVKIISTCSNLDFKSIVLQFMQNGSLEKWLHSNDLYVNLLQRIQIMVDVALALEYLHYHHHDVIIHCDLKPSNVLLDKDMVAHVGDFGIAKLFYGDSMIELSTNAGGTIGYIAPEYGIAGKASRKGDVYSFGILLLETFTRKKPTDAMFNEELSLRRWASRAYPLRVMEIVDCKITSNECVHKRTPRVLTGIHQCLSLLIEVGLLCSEESPKERLSMKDVVLRLQEIKLKYSACSTTT